MPTTLTRVITGIILTALVACTTPTPASVTNVTIDGGDRTITLDDVLTLTATVTTTGNATTTVTWTSSNTGVATIDQNGTITTRTTGSTGITATSTADPSKSDSITLTINNPPGTVAWARQFGTSGDDVANGITTDGNGNVYAAGYTTGALDGSNAGSSDAFIRSYDSSGNHRWTRQFGTSNADVAAGIATDGNGNVYATGSTTGALEGSNAGSSDAFIRSYDSSGNHRWTRQFGTSSSEVALGIATDANGNVYTTGYTTGALEGSNAGSNDAFIRSYDSSGNHRWTRQFGTSNNDFAIGIATDANGNVYATGDTEGALEGSNAGSSDAFIRSYDSSGNHRWTRQFGTSSSDVAFGIATDANGNIYATGYTTGALEGSNAGDSDAFIRSYDSSGNHRWTRQFGTSSDDFAYAIATDANGNIYATGYTTGALEGSNAGDNDAFIRSYDSSGNHRWTRQLGTSSIDEASGITTDANGNVYATGDTEGALEGSNAGGFDAFIRRYEP
jgi:hypothetical protein